jgi:NhaA family Na+:H+ antiporter
VDPLTEFLHEEAIGGLVLLLATVAALVWANSPAREAYDALWASELKIGLGDIAITEDLRHWVNDALMVLFFFVVGLEIKREMTTGELSDRKAAQLPIIAALGGTVLPAIVFVAVLGGAEGASGWAIPMATDIAFAVGVIALFGDRIPSGVKVFLLAVAVVDDIIAITVIAAVYTDDLAVGWLVAALAGVLLVVGLRRARVHRVVFYAMVGVAVWVAVHESGVHATIAGVVLGLLTPARPIEGRELLPELEHRLHPVTSLLIVPLFALANAGVALGGDTISDAASSKLTWGIVAGLVVGKLAGIGGGAVAARRAGAGEFPEGMRPGHSWGVAALGGIGFTVSLFIAQLAFESPTLQEQAKVGIFAGSLVSGLLGLSLLAALGRR